jgi:hypothetical protein
MPTNLFPVISLWEKNSFYSLGFHIVFITYYTKNFKPWCNNLIMSLEGITTQKTKNKELSAVYINEILFYLARFYSISVKRLKLKIAENVSLRRKLVSHI